MKNHLSLICIMALIYSVSSGFVYQGVRQLPFAPNKVESVNDNLLLINPQVIRQMKLGSNFYSMQFGYTPPYYLTKSNIAYQQQEKSFLTFKDINLLPQITYVNEQTNYVLERGLVVDGKDVIVPLSGGKMAIGILSTEGKLNIQTIQGADYFEYGSIAKIHDKQLAIGCKEHLYIIDRDTYKITQKIVLEQMMLEQYKVEFSYQGETEVISIRNSNVYWVYERSAGLKQFTLLNQVHYNAWMNTIFQYSQHITYILTPSCEVLQQDLTMGDNFLSFNSDQYFFDKTIAVSSFSTYFLSNTGYLQILNFIDTLISIHSRLPGFQEHTTVTQAEFTGSGNEVYVLSSGIIQRYVISSKEFDPITIKSAEAFTFSVDYKLIFTISKADSILVFSVYDASNFEKVVSLNFHVDQVKIVEVSIYKVYDKIQNLVYPFILVCKIDNGEFRFYSISYSEQTKTITRQAYGKIPKDYQILSNSKTTSFVCLVDNNLELRNWKGDRISTKWLSRSPNFIKAGQTKVMVTYEDGVSDFYNVNTQFIYIGSHYRQKDGADHSTLFLQKLNLVYTYHGGGVFYKAQSNYFPITAKSKLQNNLCSHGIGKAIISKTSYGAQKDFFVAFVNYNNSQIIYTEVVPDPRDNLHFTTTKTVNITRNVTLDRDSEIAYNPANDMLYITAKINNQSKTMLMGAVFKSIGDNYKWRWSYFLKRIDDFDFDLEGNLAILGQTTYGNIYKFGRSEQTFNEIKLRDVLATNRAGDMIFIKKQTASTGQNDGVTVGAVFNVKEAKEQYTFELPQIMLLCAINSEGDLVIVQTDSPKSINIYRNGKVQNAVIFQASLLSIGFQSKSEFFIQTDSAIIFFQVTGIPIQIQRKYVRSKSSKFLYASNDTNFILQQSERLVILDQKGNEVQQLSLPKSKKSSIQSLMITSNQQIIASHNSSIYSWKDAKCSDKRQNNYGVCECIQNSMESSGSCDCIRGYYFNSGNCDQCGTFCDTCDQNGCIDWNIALFASLGAGVLVVLAMAWYGVRRFLASSPKLPKDSLLSETAQGSTIIEE